MAYRRLVASNARILIATALSAAVIIGALALGHGAVARAEAAPGDPVSIEQSREYAACMDLARSDPVRGFERAQLWFERGGKAAAVHCSAVALIGQRQFALAAKTLEHLAGDGQGTPVALKGDLLGQAGQAWLMAGKDSRAVAAFSKAVAAAPRDVELKIDRAFAYAGLGRHNEAINDLSRALELAPGRADAYLYRAGAYRRLNNLALAARDIDRSLALGPGNPDAYLERGIIRRLSGDDRGADGDWRHVIATAPKSAAARDARRNLEQLRAPVQ
jgi:tetratricopeptide (TPR) repeat protein